VTVLAEEAVPLKDLDRAAIEAQLKNLNEDVADAKSEEERAAAASKVAVAHAKLEALGAAAAH
jgi:F-type H+-transporting ATPase subunit epsilon